MRNPDVLLSALHRKLSETEGEQWEKRERQYHPFRARKNLRNKEQGTTLLESSRQINKFQIAGSMIVAYITADFDAVSNILADPDKFVKADPFPFLLTALIIYVFGPGEFSLDTLLKRRWKNFSKQQGGTGGRSGSPARHGN